MQNPVNQTVQNSGASEPVVTADTRMDPELKAKWVAALRSGEYKQAREALRKPNGDELTYCCLGVLCTMVPGIEWDTDWDAFYVDDDGERYDADGELPSPVRAMAGIPLEAIRELVGMNDGNEKLAIRSHTFSEIADWIDANL